MKNLTNEAIILAIGLGLMGKCIGSGIESIAERDRAVSVRGLAEKEVKADHVIWPLVYRITGNHLNGLYDEIGTKNQKIIDFLVSNGISKEEITTTAPNIIDKETNAYNSDYKGDRYNVSSILTVSTRQVDKVLELIPRIGELLKSGIAVVTNDYETNIQFEFTSLNDIKPQMIEEATRNAREAAEKFATDSDSKLGKIQSATQGLFSITDRDRYTPHIKNVRVVTSVKYSLDS